MIEYPKIHTLGSVENKGILDEIVVCQSKIDGANFRCQVEGDHLIYGSHHQLLINPSPEKWIAIRSYEKAFKEHPENFISGVMYCSESMQKHTIKYENMPDTIGYDVYDFERGEFYEWRAAKQAFEQIGIPFIHIHFEKPGKDITIEELKELMKAHSPYRKEGDEGVTLKCYKKKNVFGRPLFAKLVDDLFKEENRKVFKGQIPTVSNYEQELLDRYLTPARFNKAILKLEVKDMSKIPVLFQYLADDILSENILDIIREKKILDFKIFSVLTAKRCVIMLKQYLASNSG